MILKTEGYFDELCIERKRFTRASHLWPGRDVPITVPLGSTVSACMGPIFRWFLQDGQVSAALCDTVIRLMRKTE